MRCTPHTMNYILKNSRPLVILEKPELKHGYVMENSNI